MKLLILGGPKFLGRYVIEAALANNHDVTVFNRGQTNPDLYPEIEKLRGNRDGDLTALHGRSWDAVIDTCGYVPRLVEASAKLLADAADHYTFVSSISVYAGTAVPGLDETAPLGTMADETIEEINGETYGPLKVLCEQAVERSFPGRANHVRAGLIVGPHDPSDRFTYWPYRLHRGGEVLAPGLPDTPVQFVDVRDLAGWMVRMAESRTAGAFNATGPDTPLTMGELLTACREAGASDAAMTWVDDAFLLEKEVGPWMELPLWIPASDKDAPGFSAIDCRRAFAAGLTFRPLAETVRDTLAWVLQRDPDWTWRAGMDAGKETAVLQAWHQAETQKS
ncbi:MAG: SDR family oxidoreductase [Anaerolineales bacterium]|nr:SDR family oxidoreductase [Anaerolineales bacterium]